MNFNKHYNLVGEHAILSASKYSWLNKNDEELANWYATEKAAERGTRLHAIAAELISEGIRVQGTKTTFARYVNDAIGFKMTPEQVLYYSPYCFGTADAICYNEKDHVLLIHDLKTGNTPAHMEQLIVYSALFYLEYHIKPESNKTILRLYQNGNITEYIPDYMEIEKVMDTIIKNDNYIKMFK